MTHDDLIKVRNALTSAVRNQGVGFSVTQIQYDALAILDAAIAEPEQEPITNSDLYSISGRLALELECLLLDTKDINIVSKWWDSAHDALGQWQKFHLRACAALDSDEITKSCDSKPESDAMRLYKAVDQLATQAGEDAGETIDWLCGEHGGMFKLFEAYFSPKPLANQLANQAETSGSPLDSAGSADSAETFAKPEYPLDKKADNARELWLDYEPEQEPVAYVEKGALYWCDDTSVYDAEKLDGSGLYTTPPKREWVGLTEAEICDCMDEACKSFKAHRRGVRGQQITIADSPDAHLAWAVEQVLKAKNANAAPQDQDAKDAVCEWTEDSYTYESSCGKVAFCTDSDYAQPNEYMKFCYECGKPIKFIDAATGEKP